MSARICSRCATQGVGYVIVEKEEIFDKAMGSPSTWKPKKCQVCDFLFRSLPVIYQAKPLSSELMQITLERVSLHPQAGVIMRAFNPDDLSLALVWTHSGTGQQKSCSSAVYVPTEPWFGVKLTSPNVDFTMVSEWLKQSIRDDVETTRNLTGNTNSNNSLQRSVRRARSGVLKLCITVIDCTTRCLIPLPTTAEYVTLSYVWGQASDEIRRETPRRPDSFFGSLRRSSVKKKREVCNGIPLALQLPLTIEDSIKVCESLGYRYLWVDRYCIRQDDCSTHNQQIRHMDDIYCGSVLTIIACAGEGPHYGLPGISSPRKPSSSLLVTDEECLKIIPTVRDITSSKWASRAWTYQEALLAPRRLFFTERQVYFESATMVDSELTNLMPAITRVLDPRIYSQVTSSIYPGDIYACIQEYSRRDLSFPEDALNALLGILAYYGHERETRNLWGVPFTKHTPASINEPPRKGIITFEESLRWYAMGRHIRREGFPSWCWAGWYDRGAISVEVELSSGTMLSWAEYQKKYAELNDDNGLQNPSSFIHLSRFIHIEADVSQFVRGWSNVQAFEWASLGIEAVDGVMPLSPVMLSDPIPDRSFPSKLVDQEIESYLLVHFQSWEVKESLNQHLNSVLLIRDRGEYWERIALFDDENRFLQYAKKTRRKVRLG
ncbi:HET-domain-containing protein [Ophiobolus disseminans]|uniref:HET-domain-containing protein n=1 Tax=Ophiobolus disseminans TaxID=1469910 RepID=A0A6A6ZX50_9PLEO|nr:HET-domain-containing protein [Ophiobolus disseminans]